MDIDMQFDSEETADQLDNMTGPDNLESSAQLMALALASAMSGVDELLHLLRDKVKAEDLGVVDIILFKFCQWATIAWFDEMDRNKIETIITRRKDTP